jgi:hypothetical protein
MVRLTALDPQSSAVSDQDAMPENLLYGLIDFKLTVNTPGSSSTVTIYLPQPLPADYRLYKYSSSSGWYDYSAYTSFNSARDRISLILIDGGTGDDDGEQDGFIEDPFGLGRPPATTVSTNNVGSSSGGSGGGSCFIDTARVDSRSNLSRRKHARQSLLFLCGWVLFGLTVIANRSK